MQFTTKKLETTFKKNEGVNLKNAFESLPQPIEGSGYCHRNLLYSYHMGNADALMCGRQRRVHYHVGTKLEIDYYEISPKTVETLFYILFDLRWGSGVYVEVDGVATCDRTGERSWRWIQCKFMASPGQHKVVIYVQQHRQYRHAYVLFKRRHTEHWERHWHASLQSLQYRTAQVGAYLPTRTAVQKIQNRVGKTPHAIRNSMAMSVLPLGISGGSYWFYMRSIQPRRRRQKKNNDDTILEDEKASGHHRAKPESLSLLFVPANEVVSKTYSAWQMAIPKTSSWHELPELKSSIKRSGPGVLMVSLESFAFASTKANGQDTELKLSFGIDSGGSAATQQVFSSKYIQGAFVPASFQYFREFTDSDDSTDVAVYSQSNIQRSVQLFEPKLTLTYMPGATMDQFTVPDNVNVKGTFASSHTDIKFSCNVIMQVTGQICRTAKARSTSIWITWNNYRIRESGFYITQDSIGGMCEPLIMSTVASYHHRGRLKVGLYSFAKADSGFYTKDVVVRIIKVPRASLISREDCLKTCQERRVCFSMTYDKVAGLCYLHRRHTPVATGVTHLDYYERKQSLNPLESALWTIIPRKFYGHSLRDEVTTSCETDDCSDKGCGGFVLRSDVCRCMCLQSRECIGFNYHPEKKTCNLIPTHRLEYYMRTWLSNARYNSPSEVHMNLPSSCKAIKEKKADAPSGKYQIYTGRVVMIANCDMGTDGKAAYTSAACDSVFFWKGCRWTRGPRWYDYCKYFGLQMVVPRTFNHFNELHKTYGSIYFGTVPGVYCKGCRHWSHGRVSHAMSSAYGSRWQAIDGGSWWLRDDVLSFGRWRSPWGHVRHEGWLGMYYWGRSQNIQHGVVFRDYYHHFGTYQYICSTNDVSPASVWETVSQSSFNYEGGAETTWTTTWAGSKLYDACPGMMILGGYGISGKDDSMTKLVSSLPSGLYNMRITMDFFFYGQWDMGKHLAFVKLGDQDVWMSKPYGKRARCRKNGDRTEYFHKATVSIIVRNIQGETQTIKIYTNLDGSKTTRAFAVDNVKIDIEHTYSTDFGLSQKNPAASCAHVKHYRELAGETNPTGLHWIQPVTFEPPRTVICNDGWLVAQQRMSTRTSYNRRWHEFKRGFVNNWFGDWFVGNDLLATVTQGEVKVKIVLSSGGVSSSATYDRFRVGFEHHKYVLTVDQYNAGESTATDEFSSSNGALFSARHRDYDTQPRWHCARHAGFWYNKCKGNHVNLHAPFVMEPICMRYARWARNWCNVQGGIRWGSSTNYQSSQLLIKEPLCFPGSTISAGSCNPCGQGKYNPSALMPCQVCPAGTYSSLNEAESLKDCLKCPSGSICPRGSSAPDKCPAGQYSEAGQSECKICPAGYASPAEGTSLEQLVTCAKGTYSPRGSIQCYAVPAGMYCPLSEKCTTDHLKECGDRAVYCPEGSSSTAPVPDGYYSTGSLDGFTQSGIVQCPEGFYCYNGGAFKCPVTRYGSRKGESKATCTGRCSTGCFCPPGSTSACAQIPGTASRIAFQTASIDANAYHLTNVPGTTSTELIQGILTSDRSRGYAHASWFNWDDYLLCDVKWNDNYGWHFEIKFYARTASTFQFEISDMHFSWGLVIRVDGTTLVERTYAEKTIFDVVASKGSHVIELFAASEKGKPTFGFVRFRVDNGPFQPLRVDVLDQKPILVDIHALACFVGAACESSITVDRQQRLSKAEPSNYLALVILTSEGTVNEALQYNMDSQANLRSKLNSLVPGTSIILTASTISKAFDVVLLNMLRRFGLSFDEVHKRLHNGANGFILLGSKDAGETWTMLKLATPTQPVVEIKFSIPIASGEFRFEIDRQH